MISMNKGKSEVEVERADESWDDWSKGHRESFVELALLVLTIYWGGWAGLEHFNYSEPMAMT
jgi:hypothetical protein